MRAWALLGLCACRFGFAELSDAGGPDGTRVTITFGERTASSHKNVTADSYLDEMDPAFNFGGVEDLSIAEFNSNDEHALLRFDLQAIAPGTPIAAARMQVVRIDFGDETPGAIEVRLLGESWVEGTSMGSPSPAVSWARRDGNQPWSMPGGTTTQLLATLTPTGDLVEVALDRTIVQRWVDDPTTNHGVFITVGTNGAHFHFHARESPTRSSRPELAIDVLQ